MKKNLYEEILSTEIAFSGSFLKVEKDLVKGPDGKTYSREYIKHPGAAMIIPLAQDGRVIMIEQYRHAVKSVCLEFPAGKRDQGEDSEVTARRELLEETGYRAQTWTCLTRIYPVIGYSDEFIDLFLAENLRYESSDLDEGEFLEVIELTPSELLERVRRGEVPDVKTQIGAFWLAQHLQLLK